MQGFDPNGAQFQDVGYPQPPQQQPQQPVQLPPPEVPQQTLGQVHDAAQMAPPVPTPAAAAPGAPDDYLAQYERALQVTRQMVQPAKMDMPDPHSGPGLLENLATFGMAGLVHRDAVNAQAARAGDWNRKLELSAAELAKGIVNSHANSQALAGKDQLAQLGMELRLLQYQETLRQHGITNFNAAHDRAYKDTLPLPKSPQEADMQGDTEPAPGFPNRLVRKGNSWALGTPAAAGSPADQAGLGPSATQPPAGGAATTPNPGESRADFTRRKAAEAKKTETLSIPTGSSRTMAETAPKVLDAIQTIRDDLTKVKTGAVSSRIQSFGTALGLPNPAFKQYQVDVGLLRALFMRMHVGSRGAGNSALLEQYKGMIDAGKDSPQNMGASLDALEKYTNDIVKHGAQGIDASGSSAPNPSGAPTQATQPTSLDALLKKHGY